MCKCTHKKKNLCSLATWMLITSKNSVLLCNSDGELENSMAQQLIANENIYVYNLFVFFCRINVTKFSVSTLYLELTTLTKKQFLIMLVLLIQKRPEVTQANLYFTP